MRFAASALVAAALLAAATPVLSTPGEVSAGFDIEANVGPFHGEIAASADLDVELCRGKSHAGAAVGVEIGVGCNFHSVNFRARMNTPAHLKYEEALEIYHDVQYIIRHTLMTRGLERLKRLIEITSLVKTAEDLLVVAEVLNANDGRKVRKSWIQHEISHLRSKLRDARFISMHLPNLCLAEDIFHFAVDASVAVVEFAVAVPIAIGAAIGIAVHEAAHLVARAFHYMGHILHWAIDEIEYAFLMFRRKVRRGIHKLGRFIHRIGHDIKEGLEDGITIVADIGHHLFHHHRCHRRCEGNTGVIVIGADESSSDSSQTCDCQEDDGYAAITEVCVESDQVCTKEQYTANIKMYDIELSWTKEESHTKVQECVTRVNAALGGLTTELRGIEAQVMRADFE